ncbi:hypothetical protein [Rhodococcus ruber]|uniref:DUF7426 family protein n=1 Tax=Rhodococcus ruber TaxID=1830 RepID=UPI000C7D3117|nr:hypothetical protein [Rhodococcus ruber]AUM18224.1 hypothetical protein CSW53_17850 [Rhodococcus ruber]
MLEVDTLLNPDLELPLGDRTIRVPPPTAHDGLYIRRQMLTTGGYLPADLELAAIRRILGDTQYAELNETVDEAAFLHIGRTALYHWCGSPTVAATYWNRTPPEPDPEPEPVDESAPGYLGPDDPGGGPIIDAKNGIRAWFNPPSKAPKPVATTGGFELSWRDMLDCWHTAALDLQTVYNVDVESGILHQRPWPWLEHRLQALATTPGTRLHTAIATRVRRTDQ